MNRGRIGFGPTAGTRDRQDVAGFSGEGERTVTIPECWLEGCWVESGAFSSMGKPGGEKGGEHRKR